jgi:hypothetical protein
MIFGLCLVPLASAAEMTVARPGDNLPRRLAEAEKTTGTLFLTKGLYALDEPLVVNGPVRIIGAAKEAVIIYPAKAFRADALIEVVGGEKQNVRGVTISQLLLACTYEDAAEVVKCGIVLGRDGNRCESNSHVLDHVGIVGRFKYGVVLLGTELSSLRDCSVVLTAPGGVGLYASPENRIDFCSARLQKLIAGGTTTYNHVSGGVLGAGPGGSSVRFDGYVVAWTFTNVFFGVAAEPGSESVIRLHGLQSPNRLLVPSQLTFIGCGNDQLRTRFGLYVTSERPDRVGADRLIFDNCYLLSREYPVCCKTAANDPGPETGLIRHWAERNSRFLKNGAVQEVRP